ncbi:7 transmembrane receptor (Secretin family) domain-containing protein [Phthorimaea operculella]|nr:7 transmembrane receptor (Secretin family) domain-containing protein [Phthorimaea operculella]
MTKISVVFLAGLVAFASAKTCCLPGQVLTPGEECHDLATGVNSSVSLTCTERMVAERKEMKYFVNFAGQLQFPTPNRIMAYEPETFCQAWTEDGRQVALICNDEEEHTIDPKVFGFGMGVSAIFLIATAAIYIVNGQHRALYGKSVINLCVSLAIGLFIMMVMNVMDYEDMNWCAIRGFSAYYFILVSFFWMNAISIQTITSRKHGDLLDKTSEAQQFTRYMLYTWGMPALLTTFMTTINFMPGDHLKPGIGLNTCWFFDKAQQWQYMYSVMSVLIVVNMVIFGANIALLCCDAQTHSEPLKHKISTCIKLFVVMGIPWVFEMISSLTPPHLVWDILDLFNALQGVWIFIVLVLLRSEEKPVDSTQYKINIISSASPYAKLERTLSELPLKV